MKIYDITTESVLNEGRHDPHIFKSVFVIGPPGSGKNTVAQRFMSRYSFKQEDIDDVLHKYKQIAIKNNRQDVDYSKTFPLVSKRRSLWQQNYLPIIFNTTGRRYDRIAELKSNLESTGYDTLCVFVYVTEETAWQRTQSRMHTSTNPADKGRVVDRDYFVDTYNAVKASAQQYKQLFKGNFIFYINDEKLSHDETQQYQTRKSLKAINEFVSGPVKNPEGQRKIEQFNQ
jgi:adenylate kinase family enzyme